MIKVVIYVPAFPNIKNEARLQEEKKLMNLVEKFANSDDALVVDFGCGTSYYTGEKAVGIDLDHTLLKKARLKYKILADYKFCPLKNEVSDVVVMCHSLEHTNLPEEPLSEAYRILKKNGIIALSVPNQRSLHALWVLLYRSELKFVGPEHPDHLTAFTPKLLRQALQKTGFKPIAESGDIVYFPLMEKLGLMKFGYWLADRIPTLANVYIVVAKKEDSEN